MPTSLPSNFLLFNDYQTKNIAIVVKIPGLDLLSNRPIYTKIRWGDPIFWGEPDMVWGGGRLVPGVRDILSLEGSSLTISQRLEPEQGRASVSMLTLAFVDKDQYMSKAIARGVIIDEILNKEALVYVGYEQTSYPEDYFVMFRGRVSQVESASGRVTLQFSDPNLIRRQNLFFSAKTILSAGINSTQTDIFVVNNADFHKQILGPGGGYDPAIKTYIKIEDEIIEYPATGFGSNQFNSCVRGSRGTVNVAHATGTEVSACVQIEDHGIEMALKLMLSGWNGPYLSSLPIKHIAYTGDPVVGDPVNGFVLDDKINADIDYGIRPGDYITISGSGIGGNNQTVLVTDYLEFQGIQNNIILTNGTFTSEMNSPAVFSVRSQYDTYPESCSLGMTPKEVDVEQHINLFNTFLASSENGFRFFIQSQQSGKTFIESEIYLPMAAYSLTRQGRLSMGYTKPPIADQRLQILTEDNVLNPETIKPMRGLNMRKFFNEIQWAWDYDDTDQPVSRSRDIDTTSLNTLNISSVLPINSKGGRTDLGFATIMARRNSFLLNRYKDAAVMMDIKVNFGLALQIEAGDIVAVKDDGILQISNFSTGERNSGTALYEVVDRTLNFGAGSAQLKLISGLAGNIDDRYATVAPSSLIGVPISTTQFKIKDSFGAFYPGQEWKKWQDYIGLKILVHNKTWTQSSVTTLVSMDSGDRNIFTVTPALPWIPGVDYIIDLDNYPTNTDVTDQQLAKLIHCFFDASVVVTSGGSTTQFDVGAGDVAKFQNGFPLYVHNANYSILSPEVKVQSIAGTTITVDSSLGFTPSAGQRVELLGFADGGGPYRFV